LPTQPKDLKNRFEGPPKREKEAVPYGKPGWETANGTYGGKAKLRVIKELQKVESQPGQGESLQKLFAT